MENRYLQLSADGGAQVLATFSNADTRQAGLVYFNRLKMAGLIPDNLVLVNVVKFLSENNDTIVQPAALAEQLRTMPGRHIVASENRVPRFGALFGHVWRQNRDDGEIALSQITLPEQDWRPAEHNNSLYRRTAAQLILLALHEQHPQAPVSLTLSATAGDDERAFYSALGAEAAENSAGGFMAHVSTAEYLRSAILDTYELQTGNLD